MDGTELTEWCRKRRLVENMKIYLQNVVESRGNYGLFRDLPDKGYAVVKVKMIGEFPSPTNVSIEPVIDSPAGEQVETSEPPETVEEEIEETPEPKKRVRRVTS